MAKDQVLTVDKVNNQIAKLALQMEKGEIDSITGQRIATVWGKLLYGLQVQATIENQDRGLNIADQELELKAEDQKAIDDLLSTIKTGLKDLDKKPTKPKTTKGGGKRCQKK